MEIKIIVNPDRKITQSMLYFQFRFMGWTDVDMVDQDDRFGSLPFGYIVAYSDGQMIGAINLLKRKINWQGREVTLGGFGGVCTHDQFRRQGVASILLQKGMEVLKEKGIDIAYLSTDLTKLKKLYSKVGFLPLNRQYRATGLSGKVYLDEGGMIAPVNSKEIFQQILNDNQIFDIQGQDW